MGWFQGRMEFGPRALGARSILGDAAVAHHAVGTESQGQVPRVVPPVRARRCCARTWRTGSNSTRDSPYMLLVADVVKHRRRAMTAGGAGAVRHRQAQRAAFRDSRRHARRLLGAHPDRARRDQPALPRAARARSSARTGCPVLVNTSFNVRGEPIVCTPEDAFRCFMGTEIEMLAAGNCLLHKQDQDPRLRQEYKSAFDPIDLVTARTRSPIFLGAVTVVGSLLATGLVLFAMAETFLRITRSPVGTGVQRGRSLEFETTLYARSAFPRCAKTSGPP